MKWLTLLALLLVPNVALGEWRISPPFDARQSLPREFHGEYVPIQPGDAGATFRLPLDSGRRHVRAQFSDCAGRYASAYYLLIRRIE